MMPVLWRVPGLGFEITSYGLILMIGFLLSIVWAAYRAQRSGANPDVILNCGFFALFGGVIGARFMYVWHYWDELIGDRSGMSAVWAILDVRKGGLEIYGGLILAAGLILIYLRRSQHSVRWYLDIIAPSAALGMAIGRLGCFMNGCCFGGVCHLPWCITFPYGSPPSVKQWVDSDPGAGLPRELLVFAPQGISSSAVAAAPVSRTLMTVPVRVLQQALDQVRAARDRVEELRTHPEEIADSAARKRVLAEIKEAESKALRYADIQTQVSAYHLSVAELRAIAERHRSLPVHPTQLYSFITLGLLALLLNALYWRRTRDGQVVCVLFLIEPWTRWALEVVRADNPVDVGGQTISQVLAIVLTLAAIAGLLWLQKLPPRSPRARLWKPESEQAGAAKKGKPERAKARR